MTRRRDARPPAGAHAPSRRRGRTLAVIAVLGLAVALGVALSRSERGPSAPGPSADASPRPSGSRPPASAPAGESAPRRFVPLLGEWLRPDGGYVLSVQHVAEDGGATVEYFNPRPIRVARAEARQEGALVGLFVEFDDVGYPGSTYTLGYDAASDQLHGIYYQAVQGAQYEVAFVRRR